MLAIVIRRLGRTWAQLRRDQRGVSGVELGLMGPLFIMLLLGIYDVGYTAYLHSVLQGAVQQVARNGTLEDANTAKADTYVTNMIHGILPGSQVVAKRVSYYDFADIKRAESWNDKNGNGVCDKSESFTDENRSGQWDADVGSKDNGGANDVVLYTVKVTYKSLFPNPFMASSTNERSISASAVRKNQPYALQEKYGSGVGVCP
jgi:Flp pilus assembly protein TadG